VPQDAEDDFRSPGQSPIKSQSRNCRIRRSLDCLPQHCRPQLAAGLHSTSPVAARMTATWPLGHSALQFNRGSASARSDQPWGADGSDAQLHPYGESGFSVLGAGGL